MAYIATYSMKRQESELGYLYIAEKDPKGEWLGIELTDPTPPDSVEYYYELKTGKVYSLTLFTMGALDYRGILAIAESKMGLYVKGYMEGVLKKLGETYD